MTLSVELAELEARIDSRLARAGYPASPTAVSALAIHLSMTLDWARSMSLTSVRSAEEAIERHVVESVGAAMVVDKRSERGLDVGSGNGYPAIPMKALNPGIKLILLEPHLRRSVFLEQVARKTGLTGIEVRRARIDRVEDLEKYAPMDLISMRGVARTDVLVGGSPKILSASGQLVLLLGEKSADAAVQNAPGSLEVELDFILPCRGRTRLVVLRKRPQT